MFIRWYASPSLRSVTIRPPVPMACVVVNSRKMRIFFMVRPYPAVTRDQFAGPQNTELTTFDMNVFQILDVVARFLGAWLPGIAFSSTGNNGNLSQRQRSAKSRASDHTPPRLRVKLRAVLRTSENISTPE